MKKQYQHISISSQNRAQASWPVVCSFNGKPRTKAGIFDIDLG
jgi:hypothetical protein